MLTPPMAQPVWERMPGEEGGVKQKLATGSLLFQQETQPCISEAYLKSHQRKEPVEVVPKNAPASLGISCQRCDLVLLEHHTTILTMTPPEQDFSNVII